jgi:hypothetical protein
MLTRPIVGFKEKEGSWIRLKVPWEVANLGKIKKVRSLVRHNPVFIQIDSYMSDISSDQIILTKV